MKGLSLVVGTFVLMGIIRLSFFENEVRVVWAQGDVVPQRITIEKLKMNQQIVPGIIKGSDWQIDENNVNYLVGSGNLDVGNIVLYAHKKWQLFGNLRKLREGDILELASGNKTNRYQIIYLKQVKASDVSVLQDIGDSRLTLFTCDGPFDLLRWVVVAKKVS